MGLPPAMTDNMHNVRRILAACLVISILSGCGTTRWSDTARTATEQRLISNAIDESVNSIDVSSLSGMAIYFDTSQVDDTVQQKYLISSLRHHLLRNGCYLKEKKEDAQFVVEARAGVIGTDRHDVLVGIPETSVATGLPGLPSHIPEVALFKKTNQLGMAKIGLFAYERQAGKLVWSSDMKVSDELAKNVWAFGIGPIQSDPNGKGTRLAGEEVKLPTIPVPSIPQIPQIAKQPKEEPPEYQMPELKEPPVESPQGEVHIKPAAGDFPFEE